MFLAQMEIGLDYRVLFTQQTKYPILLFIHLFCSQDTILFPPHTQVFSPPSIATKWLTSDDLCPDVSSEDMAFFAKGREVGGVCQVTPMC
mgnify:CR=1 FL=1